MYKIFLLISFVFLFTQCDSVYQPRHGNPFERPPHKDEGSIVDDNTTEGKPSDSLENAPPLKNVKVELDNKYPYFTINSNTGTSLRIFHDLVPPTDEKKHTNSSLAVFNILKKDGNVLLSPFIHTSSNNTKRITVDQLAETTNNKLRVVFNSNKIESHQVLHALSVQANWEQDKSSEKATMNFLSQEVSGVRILGKCYFSENSQMKLIFLPLDIDFSAYFFVPKDNESIERLLDNIKFNEINQSIQQLKKVNCEITIPSFRIYSNIATEVNERLISFLQIDSYGCEFASALVNWKETPKKNLLSGNTLANNSLGGSEESSSFSFDEEELDLAKIKSPYLKNVSEESVNVVIDKPFFFVLRHSITGEFLVMAMIGNLESRLDDQNIVQYINDGEEKRKGSVVNRFGGSYKRKKDPFDDFDK